MGECRLSGQLLLRKLTYISLSNQDHSSGSLLVAEAGGVVSDMHGKPLDFSLGRTLKGNKGVVAAPRGVHARVIEAVQQAIDESKNEALKA